MVGLMCCLGCGESFVKTGPRMLRCPPCAATWKKEQDRNYFINNKEKVTEQTSRWRAANAVRVASYGRAYYEKNRPAVIARSAGWAKTNRRRALELRAKERERNRAKHRLRAAKYYRENREKCAEASRKWKKANTLTLRSYNHARRGKEALLGPVDLNDFLRKCEIQGSRCLFCDKEGPLTIDHIIAIERGGTNDPDNIQALCLACNSGKGTKTNEEYTEYIAKRKSA